MDKLQELKNKIASLVPEIMEWKFGMRFELKFGGNTVVHNWDGGVNISDGGDGSPEEVMESPYCGAILGRPITLEDVLRALPKERMFGVTDDGEFIEARNNASIVYHTKISWTLGLPLDQQSDECIEFLAELLLTAQDHQES